MSAIFNMPNSKSIHHTLNKEKFIGLFYTRKNRTKKYGNLSWVS